MTMRLSLSSEKLCKIQQDARRILHQTSILVGNCHEGHPTGTLIGAFYISYFGMILNCNLQYLPIWLEQTIPFCLEIQHLIV